MSKQKVIEIFEDKLVAEIWEKTREGDGRRFYDTVIQRRYFVENNTERRTNFLQKRDMQSLHVLAVGVDRWINNQLWQNRDNPGGARDVETAVDDTAETDIDDGPYVEE